MLGFTLAEIHRVQTEPEPKLTVQQILQMKSCQDYVKNTIADIGQYWTQKVPTSS